MANQNNNSASWANAPPEVDEYGLQVKFMGLKVQYTFDTGSQERCLARWPHILRVRTLPMEDRNIIGIVDLKTCLQAVAQGSPELIGDNEKDYTVYAFDYSEPDMPLVGQGMLSWGLDQEVYPPGIEPKLVTGRITQNLLAVFGGGIKETLEVKLKLTAVPRIARNNSAPTARASAEPATVQRTPTPIPSEKAESFCQSNQNSAQPRGASNNPTTRAPTPIQPIYPNYEAGKISGSQGQQAVLGSRPASVEPGARETLGATSNQGPGVLEKQGKVNEELAIAPAPAKGGKPQSRPASRASSRPPSGRPRGRPRKKPLPAEGSTSGIEDATDADDGPPRSKKRATITRVERSNTATFGSTSESLRVTASTAGSLRNFRPIAVAGDTRAGSHIQELPRAPTPVPSQRMSNLVQARPTGSSSLRRESNPGPGMEHSFTSSYLDLNRSASYSQDARSPAESAGVSPCQFYSDEASPADISSSPPVPRSTLYSAHSSPTPSSPILPPMPMAMAQPDSGYMSGMLDGSRVEEDAAGKIPADSASKVPMVVKPKPRRSRAKKVPAAPQSDLIIHTETPGPPELLPQTSIYNPPHLSRKNSEAARTPTVSEPQCLPAFGGAPSEAAEPEIAEEQHLEKVTSKEETATQGDITNPEATTLINCADQHRQHLDNLSLGSQSFTPVAEESSKHGETQLTMDATMTGCMEPPTFPQPSQSTSVEPELPMVPASDPITSRLTFPAPMSEPAHPQTDAVGPTDGKANKNFVKRQTIRQKLEEAIAQGQLPSFCNNCGALQTPTWRKIWKQACQGIPTYHEYSDKPGHVTAINVLTRDGENNPTSYEVIKKSLGPTDTKSAWTEVLLCNPCGIWFSKFKQHRPAEKWEKDEQRLSQTRKKRANGSGLPRAKKPRTKNDTNPTSESGFLPTDPLGPMDNLMSLTAGATQHQGDPIADALCRGSTFSRGSTHSRGSGTPGSPIAVDEDLGGTRRLLFPSPRKEGEQKILGEVAVNIVQTSPDFLNAKVDRELEKENADQGSHEEVYTENDFADIFGTPPRPSTPPPKTNSGGPFKTPTRPTPGHRPVTRSVTRSMRSVRSITSPTQILMMDRTPTRTPRSSMAKPHSPKEFLPSHLLDNQIFDTPMSRAFDNTLPNTDQPMMPSPSHFGLDMSSISLPMFDGINTEPFDMGFFDADVTMPSSSSPPMRRNFGQKMKFGQSLEKSVDYFTKMDAGTVHIHDTKKNGQDTH
ncbi:hypothetical protein F5Y13DRAFT_196559 [Hypoxylon sp. FL1857]|nr:hypothetical protein F5Y13DRAFT_196559 [Hypoxylon sp. FL1857]